MQPLWGSDSQDHRMNLAREWDDLVDQIRELDGFHDFLKPKPLSDLLPAASDGPVVIINMSRWRCDALLVRDTGVHALPLPQLSLDTATAKLKNHLSVLQTMDAAIKTVLDARHLAATTPTHAHNLAALRAGQALSASEHTVDTTLTDLNEWTWDTIAEPILDALDFPATPAHDGSLPRVWLCPTGPLTLLPLHAAGTPQRSLIDICVPSYTPTLQSLLDARTAPTPDKRTSQRVLLVSTPSAQFRAPSHTATREHVLRALIPAPRITILDGLRSHPTAVLSELRHHDIVHFDCHGDQNLNDPSSGGLQLGEQTLTILDIANQSSRGEFAGLAACKTAVGGIDLLDEAITLTAALHYTGYRHVVGTLWSVRDNITRDLFDQLYRNMLVAGRLDTTQAPVTLHTLVRQLRRTYPEQPRLWAPFIHMGP
ncbi:CHAT domain-containing protein [Nocardia beijingensis]